MTLRFFPFYFLFILFHTTAWTATSQNSWYDPQEFPKALNRCFLEYSSQFKVPGQMTIAIALGYNDALINGFDMVKDGLVLDNLALQLTQPCQYANQGFCNFTLEKLDPFRPRHYFREIVRPITEGGEQNEETIHVDLYLMNSSYKVSHLENQTKYKTQQILQSQAAQQFYSWALENADAVFYEGHSRDGGGPDFFPPNMNQKGRIDYSWYKTNQPGLKLMTTSLQRAKSAPLLLGLFSCASDAHFTETLSQILEQNPYETSHKTSLILSSRLIDASSARGSLFRSLESLLNFECVNDLKTRIHSSDFVIREIKSFRFVTSSESP